jgi:hypothetical protein
MLRRIGYGLAGIAATAAFAVTPTASADDPPTPDPTIMDVLDSVLAGSAPAPTTPAPPPNASDIGQ